DPMFEPIRRTLRPLMLALTVAVGALSCGPVEETDADLVAAQKLVQQAIRTLDAGDYQTAKIDLEKLIAPQSNDAEATRLSTALKKDVESLDQARMAYVMARTLSQIDDWIKLISQ